MIEVTELGNLGHADHGWLNSRFHFSFADYRDPERVWFGPLRVWNDDLIKAGGGFPMHPHRDFEIITYVREGQIAHEDSLGNQGVTGAGQVQVMSAGTGIVHSEFNGGDEDLRLFQIWVAPDTLSLPPRWEARTTDLGARRNGLVPLASGEPRYLSGEGKPVDGILRVFQDATLYAGEIDAGKTVTHALADGRQAYLVPARGSLRVNGVTAPNRSGIAVVDESSLEIEALEDSEVVLLDLPGDFDDN